MNRSSNKKRGSIFELKIINQMKFTKFFTNIGSSRQYSRSRDGEGLDVVSTDESLYGRLNYNLQTKTIQGQPNYQTVLEYLPKVEGIPNIFIHKKTKKSEGGRFMEVGTYAFLYWDDMLMIMTDREARLQEAEKYKQGFEILNQYFDSIDDEFKPEVHNKLVELGL